MGWNTSWKSYWLIAFALVTYIIIGSAAYYQGAKDGFVDGKKKAEIEFKASQQKKKK